MDDVTKNTTGGCRMKNIIIGLLLILLILVHTDVIKDAYAEDAILASVSCTNGSGGVKYCTDSRTGRTWLVYSS